MHDDNSDDTPVPSIEAVEMQSGILVSVKVLLVPLFFGFSSNDVNSHMVSLLWTG